MGAVPDAASGANRAACTAANCLAIQEHRTSAPFYGWDRKPKGCHSPSDHCHKPHPRPSCVTRPSSSQGGAGCRACKARAWLMMHFAPWDVCPRLGSSPGSPPFPPRNTGDKCPAGGERTCSPVPRQAPRCGGLFHSGRGPACLNLVYHHIRHGFCLTWPDILQGLDRQPRPLQLGFVDGLAT